jgi:hypothetical protein
MSSATTTVIARMQAHRGDGCVDEQNQNLLKGLLVEMADDALRPQCAEQEQGENTSEAEDNGTVERDDRGHEEGHEPRHHSVSLRRPQSRPVAGEPLGEARVPRAPRAAASHDSTRN